MNHQAVNDQTTGYRAYSAQGFKKTKHWAKLGHEHRRALEVTSRVFPFRVNRYVLDELIDWQAVPEDPIFQLTFPQPGMLGEDDFNRLAWLLDNDAPAEKVDAVIQEIRWAHNPHPAGQVEQNVPRTSSGVLLQGVQHKYRETVLFFPREAQTCHAYCGYCFRWPQFVKGDHPRFEADGVDGLVNYLCEQPAVSSVLFTGGDPLILKTQLLERYIEPLLDPKLSHVTSIRIGTKALAYWPQRFVSDADADQLLRLLERVVSSGRHLAIMAHYSHVRELETDCARKALARIRNVGAEVRCQAPLLRHINATAKDWIDLLNRQVQLGAIPYYMFVPRDTGPRSYFAVSLAKALKVFNEAVSSVNGLAKTIRGPCMSAGPGKVVVDGVAAVAGERVFVLRLLQARDPSWTRKVFFAKYDASAQWLDDLVPALGERHFPFADATPKLRVVT